MLSLSVFIFAYNENETLEAVARDVCNTLSTENREYEVVIIDDGSTDGTKDLALKLSKEIPHLSVIRHPENYGLGSAYRTAFKNARFDLVTFISADGQFSAQVIKYFLPLIEEQDMVLGYIPKRVDIISSKLLSRVEKFIFKLLFGPMPRFQGMLIFRRRLLDEIRLKSGGGRSWTVLMELIIRATRAKYRIISVPIQMRPRLKGTSKVNNFATIWANFVQAIALRRYL